MSDDMLARSFAPTRLLDRVPGDGRSIGIAGAVLLADLADFTGLTEALAAKAGRDGVELVGRDLNQVLGPVIDAVVNRGGEVVKFSGDGLLCVFAGYEQAIEAARLAARDIAAVAVQGPSGQIHQFRVAIVHGSVALASIGGHRGRRELVAGGEAVEQAQQRVTQARPGDLGPELRLPALPPDRQPTPVPIDDPQCYLPDYVRERLGLHLSQWLQELRSLTIVFASRVVDPVGSELQPLARAVQVVVDRHGGQLLRFSFEGRLLVAELAFGLSVGAAAAGPTEALRGAVALLRRGLATRIGVSTGRVLLGPVGSTARRQLTTLGSIVNLAARLMQHAGENEALVDNASWVGVEGRFQGTADRAVLKGLGERSFWRLGMEVSPPAIHDEEMVGRDREMQAIRDVLTAVDSPMRAIVIQGEAGIGKSRLCRWLEAELQRRGLAAFLSQATPVGRDTPYSGLAATIATVCGLRPGVDSEQQLRAVAQRVLGDADRAPLLGDALGLSLPDSALTLPLVGRARAENIRGALSALFDLRERPGGAALIVEDAHWLDSASWALLQHLALDDTGLCIVVACRPMLNLEPAELRALRARGALSLSLQPLSEPDLAAVLARRLGVCQVPTDLVQWVAERARGNPFFARELAAMLMALGHVEVSDGALVGQADRTALDALPLASTVESTLEQRIDQLGLEDAVALKVASVIGPFFDLDTLSALTTGPDGGSVQAVVDRLVAADMAMPAGEGRFAFRHRHTQDAAYRMLPGERRRDLHGRVAGWFERRLGDRADEHAGELAHHWFAAEVRPKALQWLESAGIQALRTGADREAATQFRRALSIADGQPAGRVAAWHRQLARAMFGLGEVEGVAVEARACVELVARRLPTSPLSWALQAGRMTLGRWMGASTRTLSADAGELLEGARAAGLLAESAYFLNAPEVMLGSALLAVDLAERTPSAAPVSTAYGMLGVVAGMARLQRTARRYLGRARSLSEAAGDPYQLGVAWFYTGMYFGCIGDWAASRDAAQRALALTEGLGADMQSGFQLTLIATNALYTSEYANTRAWMATVRSRAERAGNVQQLGWACNVVSVADLHQGLYVDAVALSAQGRQIFLCERDLVSLIIAEGVQCAALAHAGRMDDALQAAARATDLIATARPTTWGQLEGFSGPCEVYAMALAQGVVFDAQARGRFRIAIRGLRLFALTFPFGRPRLHWVRGQGLLAVGQPRVARRHLLRAIRLAQHFGMPFEELRATRLLAPLSDGPAQAGLLQRVQSLRVQVEAGAAALLPTVQPEVQAV